MGYPSFAVGDVLTANDMNAVGLWRITSGITATNGTVSSGVVTANNTITSLTVSGCFSSSYKNYRIIVSGGSASTGGDMTFQLSGSTGSTYSTGGVFTTYGSTTVTGYGPAATTTWRVGYYGVANTAVIIDVFEPQLARATRMVATSSSGFYYSHTGQDTSTAQSTGFVLGISAGTFSAQEVRVYGYRD